MSDKYVFEKTTIEGLADSVRAVLGTTDGMTASEMTSELSTFCTNVDNEVDAQVDLISQINAAIEGKSAGGITIPEMTNPASAENIDAGYEAADSEGNLITGTSTKKQIPELSNPASAGNVDLGFETVDGEGNLVVGTSTKIQLPELTNPATSENIEFGYEVINSNGEVIEGSKIIVPNENISIYKISVPIETSSSYANRYDTPTTTKITVAAGYVNNGFTYSLTGASDYMAVQPYRTGEHYKTYPYYISADGKTLYHCTGGSGQSNAYTTLKGTLSTLTENLLGYGVDDGTQYVSQTLCDDGKYRLNISIS